MACTAIAQIVTVDAGDHDIAQLQVGNGARQVGGFIHIQWIGAAMTDVTKGAAPCAFVAHDHEGGGAFAKTFANVGTTGFFANGDQTVLAENVFDLVKTGGG